MRSKPVNSTRMPIYRDAGFELYDADSARDAFANETLNERIPELYIYSRYRNPTVVDAEEEIMKLEGCSWALLTQTGMSAIDTALSVFQNAEHTRPWLFFSEIYGGTLSYIESILRRRRGLNIHIFNPKNERYDLSDLVNIIGNLRPELVYIETISNPMLIVAEVDKIIAIAHGHDSKVIIDNTFATPVLYRPLDSGADIVIHSATKYFSGHGNISAGVLCGNDISIMKQAVEYRKLVGHMISPDDAYRLNTQIQTFELRFQRQCSNAARIAELLSSSPAIGKVWYPGLGDHPTHREAVNLFREKGFGAMVTFDFKGDSLAEKRNKRDMFIKSVSDNIKLIPSLGDPKTILLPVESVWGAKYPEPGMVRLSVGFEDYNILEETVHKALNHTD